MMNQSLSALHTQLIRRFHRLDHQRKLILIYNAVNYIMIKCITEKYYTESHNVHCSGKMRVYPQRNLLLP